MSAPTETSIVYADLKDTVSVLRDARTSPKDVRRTFSRFVELSQKLTSGMRKDWSRLGRGAWEASSFTGWTPVTELVKFLRNEDQHGNQVYLSVHERRHFPIPTNLPPGFHVAPGRTFVFEGTWVLSDQLLDAPPEGISSYEVDPITQQPTGREMQLLKLERFYILQARSEEAKKKIAAAGLVDIHAIAEVAFSTLTAYYQFFCERVRT